MSHSMLPLVPVSVCLLTMIFLMISPDVDASNTLLMHLLLYANRVEVELGIYCTILNSLSTRNARSLSNCKLA